MNKLNLKKGSSDKETSETTSILKKKNMEKGRSDKRNSWTVNKANKSDLGPANISDLGPVNRPDTDLEGQHGHQSGPGSSQQIGTRSKFQHGGG